MAGRVSWRAPDLVLAEDTVAALVLGILRATHVSPSVCTSALRLLYKPAEVFELFEGGFDRLVWVSRSSHKSPAVVN